MKKVLSILFLTVLSNQLFSQDTILLKNTIKIIAFIDEVSDDYLEIHKIDEKGNIKSEKIDIKTVRNISYKNGYRESIKSIENSTTKKDEIKLINSTIISGYVLEINDFNIVLDLSNKDSTLVLPLTQISHIKYANGYQESYNNTISNDEYLKGNTIVAENVISNRKTYVDNDSATKKTATVNLKNKVVVVHLNLNTNNSKTSDIPETARLDLSTPKSIKEKFDINVKVKKPITFGIGLIIDSLSNLCRSFAVYQLLQDYPLILNGVAVKPMLIDYPFSFETDYSVTGIFYSNYALFKFYNKGKKVKEIRTANDWKDIYQKILSEINKDGNSVAIKKKMTIDEGSHYHFADSHIDEYFPGGEEIKITNSEIYSKLKNHIKIGFLTSKDLHKDVRDIFLKYSRYNENSLFFFRNDNVPIGLKDVVRPILFPLYKRLYTSVSYLDYGAEFLQRKDYGEAANCLESSLFASSIILASPYEKALIRKLTFEELTKLHSNISPNRTYIVSIFKLASDLNNEFINSNDANIQRDEYYNGIKEIQNTSVKAEDAARKIRGQKRLGGFMALASFASSVASANPLDNSISNALLNQATTTFTETFTQASEASIALNEQYKNIQETIDSKSFLTDDGERIEVGKTFLAEEVFHYMSIKPDLIKDLLFRFSSNKAELNKYLIQFYDSGDMYKNRTELLKRIVQKFAEIETSCLNYELRNLAIPNNIKNKF